MGTKGLPNPRKGSLLDRTPRHCVRCRVRMTVRRPGPGGSPTHAHYGKGECRACYNDRKSNRDRKPRTTWRHADLMAEWEFFAGDGLTRKQAAERIGVHHEALARAIQRHNRGECPCARRSEAEAA